MIRKLKQNKLYLLRFGLLGSIGVVVLALFIIRNIQLSRKGGQSTFTQKNGEQINSILKTPSPTPTTIVYQVNMNTDSTWQTYSNPEGHFSILYPAEWQLTSDKPEYENNLYYKKISLDGAEGKVTIYWTNDGYGGGCPQEDLVKLVVKNRQIKICSYVNDDGFEYFGQISKYTILPDKSWVWTYAEVIVNKPYSLNRDKVLSVLSSLKFD